MSDNVEQKKGNDSRGLALLTMENVMKTVEGRKFMMNLLHFSMVYENVFDNDTNQHSYNAGSRRVGLHLERELKEASPYLYLKMIEEDINE